MIESERDEARILDFLQHEALERCASYAAQGRRFAPLAPEALDAEWAGAFIAMCLEGDASRIQDVDDLTAEIGLRGRAVPAHLVRHAMPGIVERVRGWLTADRLAHFAQRLTAPPRKRPGLAS